MSKNKNKRFSSFLENPIDYTLLITILLLLTLGLIMVLSASSPTSLSESGKSYKYFVKQCIFASLGIVAMSIISKIDYRFYKKFYKWSYILAIILLSLVLIIGKTINGAKRWIFVTSTLSFQPSEIVKFCMIIFFAGILTRDREELKYFIKGWIKHLAWIIPIIGLLIIEPHLSSSIVLMSIIFIMMIIAGCKLWQIIVPGFCIGVPTMAIAIWKIQKLAHALKRIITFLNPWEDKLGAGWQVIQSLYAIGSRGTFWSRTWSK